MARRGSLTDTAQLLLPALAQAFTELPPGAAASPAGVLARKYAIAIDSAVGSEDEQRVLAELGPKLLAALESLGLTPRSRAALTRAGQTATPPGPSRLASIRGSA